MCKIWGLRSHCLCTALGGETCGDRLALEKEAKDVVELAEDVLAEEAKDVELAKDAKGVELAKEVDRGALAV